MAVGLLCMVMLLFSLATCARRRQATPLMSQHATTGVVVEMASVGQPAGVPFARPAVACGQAVSGLPVAQAVACPTGRAANVTHVHHHGGGGYGGGGTVAMGAGMGFLGGMMMGEMMADAGDHGGGYGGGDYGGGGGDFGGDFAADM